MSTPFTGKTILITGAGSGIGRATSLKLHSLGATLALSDINSTSVSETLSLCPGNLGFSQACDVGNSAQVTSFIETTIKNLNRIDHVFNCAGINPTSYELQDAPDDYFDKLVATNLKGVYNVTRACIPFLGSGASIVNVSSILGMQPAAQMAIYCATKYAVVGFSKAMALELGPKGIRVNVVAPGYIDTPTNANVVAGEESVRRCESRIAMGRMGAADEVADVVAYLMGEGAGYVNGAVVEINGGLG